MLLDYNGLWLNGFVAIWLYTILLVVDVLQTDGLTRINSSNALHIKIVRQRDGHTNTHTRTYFNRGSIHKIMEMIVIAKCMIDIFCGFYFHRCDRWNRRERENPATITPLRNAQVTQYFRHIY